MIDHLHALDVRVQLFADQQSLLTNQVAELDIAQFRLTQFVL
jgi:hypothetical protein